MALDSPHTGHVVRETDDKIIVFGDGKERYDYSSFRDTDNWKKCSGWT